MRKIYKKVGLILLIISIPLTNAACKMKDKQKVVSDNISLSAKKEANEIQRNIKLGSDSIEKDNYKEAKQYFDKAIALDKSNKNTYLIIKDKYLEKERLDDAYAVIKLAVNNKVDVDNMKNVLIGLKQKFSAINLNDNVKQKDKYSLPQYTTIKVDDKDTKTQIKWNKPSEVDTSKTGKYTFEGETEEYGRTVKLTLNVAAEPQITKFSAILSNAYESNGKKYLTVYLADYYEGTEAMSQVEKDGFQAKGSIADMEGYYIRYRKVSKTYEISPDANLNMLSSMVEYIDNDNKQDTKKHTEGAFVCYKLNFDDFKYYTLNLNNKFGEGSMNRALLSWVTLKDGVVNEIVGIHTP